MPNSTIETRQSVPARVMVALPLASTRMPLFPNQGFDILRREIRSEYKTLLAALDAELASLGIEVADPAPAAPHKRRWFR
jgi:hypothetical protein